MKKTSLLLVLLCIIVYSGFSQTDTTSTRKNALKIYLDCNFCDLSHIRKEVSFVNYMRDSKEAQVHILVTRQAAGNGGNEYTFTFLGQKKFANKNDTLKVISQPDATDDEIRNQQINILKLGLVYYIAHTPSANMLEIGSATTSEEEEIVEDRWKSWVFSLGTSGYFNGDSNYKRRFANANATAEKVTEETKTEFFLYYNNNETSYMIDGEEVKTLNQSSGASNLQVWSLNNHWSLGYTLHASSSDYNNLKGSFSGYPTLEYNLFPYSESTIRQLRFQLKVGYLYNMYNDTTIYNKIEEGLFKQRFTIAYETSQKWGSINASVTENIYLHDFSKNNFNLYSSLNIRIVKGLSFDLSGSVSFIHDQLYLPLEGASRDDVLLRQEQLATQYSYWGSIGLTYTFGSMYNNVVNPRFGD